MSSNKMLIDATHPEETRVVVLRDGRVEEFDYESAARKLLRGNIYLAKVTRVEPGLQAAFVDYGGNRHGFLAFNEIHPDYYQIPMADRQALLDEEAAAEAEDEAEADARAEELARRTAGRDEPPVVPDSAPMEAEPETASWPGPAGISGEDPQSGLTREKDRERAAARAARVETAATGPDDVIAELPLERAGSFRPERTLLPANEIEDDAGDGLNGHEEETGFNGENGGGVQEIEPEGNGGEPETVEQVGSDDALEELAPRARRQRSYKIHEVIKRRQVILVQVVKEERGNKGAALTTYLSLAGRYTVLMPNTARGGGISRKITNPADRKRLKAIAAELDIPEGMGLIIRTAGAARTKQEIKRDFEYLLGVCVWVGVVWVVCSATNIVYDEGNIVKRAIRDLYNKDVDEIIVAGAEAHREAKDFMRMLMPSHAKNVVLYEEPEPLFTRYQIERQLNAMFSPYVTLKSGGYLVINQTEALVAIDVNSGKSTREFSIEETALNTNLEAADEIARQLKLRDLAGLIVVDFIDMEEKRNNRAVERRLKEALRFDRARIQVGRISHFGLLELSRQRIRTGVLEGSTTPCPHCQGTGIIRSTESVALAVLRGIEDALLTGARTALTATTTPSVALYILNNKRAFILDMESRYGIPITVQGSDKVQGANFTIERAPALPANRAVRRFEHAAVNMDWGFEEEAGVDATGEPSRTEGAGAPLRDGTFREGLPRRRRRRPRREEADLRPSPAAPGAAGAVDIARRSGGEQESAAAAVGEAAGEPVSVAVQSEEEIAWNGVPAGEVLSESSSERAAEATEGAAPAAEESRIRRSRRRGRRGGRRSRQAAPALAAGASGETSASSEASTEQEAPSPVAAQGGPYVEPVHENESGPISSGLSEENQGVSQERALFPWVPFPVPGGRPAPAGAAGGVEAAEAGPGDEGAQREGAEVQTSSLGSATAQKSAPAETGPAVLADAADAVEAAGEDGASDRLRPPQPESETEKTKSRRQETPDGNGETPEPHIEHMIVGAGESVIPEPAPLPAGPARKGWWQRRLGGG